MTTKTTLRLFFVVGLFSRDFFELRENAMMMMMMMMMMKYCSSRPKRVGVLSRSLVSRGGGFWGGVSLKSTVVFFFFFFFFARK